MCLSDLHNILNAEMVVSRVSVCVCVYECALILALGDTDDNPKIWKPNVQDEVKLNSNATTKSRNIYYYH